MKRKKIGLVKMFKYLYRHAKTDKNTSSHVTSKNNQIICVAVNWKMQTFEGPKS